jgi:hypothetical protein
MPAQARGINYNTQNAIVMNNFATRQAQLCAQIDSYLAAGQLSYGQASNLRGELNSLAMAQNQGIAQGGYSPMQMQSINNGFTNVTAQLNAYVSANSQYNNYVNNANVNAYANSYAYRRANPMYYQVAPHQWHY